MTEAYVEGFSKTAEEYGISPDDLITISDSLEKCAAGGEAVLGVLQGFGRGAARKGVQRAVSATPSSMDQLALMTSRLKKGLPPLKGKLPATELDARILNGPKNTAALGRDPNLKARVIRESPRPNAGQAGQVANNAANGVTTDWLGWMKGEFNRGMELLGGGNRELLIRYNRVMQQSDAAINRAIRNGADSKIIRALEQEKAKIENAFRSGNGEVINSIRGKPVARSSKEIADELAKARNMRLAAGAGGTVLGLGGLYAMNRGRDMESPEWHNARTWG